MKQKHLVDAKVISISDPEFEIILTRPRHIFINQNRNHGNHFLPPAGCRSTTHASKAERIGLQNLASTTIFTWPLINRLPHLSAFWQLFSGKMLSQPAGGRKCFPRVHWMLKHGFLCYKNKQFFLIGKIVLIVIVPILINKDVSEPG